MHRNYTRILFGFFTTITLLAVAAMLHIAFSQTKKQVTLVNLNHVMVSSSQSVNFLFDTDDETEIRIYVEEAGSGGSRRDRLSDVVFVLTDRSNPTNYRLITPSDLGKGIRVDQSLYEFRISGDRRMRGEVSLKVRITSTPGKDLQRGSMNEYMRISNLYIQPGDPENIRDAVRNVGSGRAAGRDIILPSLQIQVEKGEEVILKTANDGLEVEVFQLARTFSMQKNAPLMLPPAERDGIYDLVFYFTKSDDRSGISRIFSRDVKGSSFDITLGSKPLREMTDEERRRMAGDPSSTRPGHPEPPRVPGSFGAGDDAAKSSGSDDIARILEASREAAQESQRELVDALQQLTRVDTTETSLPLFGDQVRLKLHPARNLFERPRACEEIRLGDAEFWAFLIGAGEDALKQFDERDQRIRENSRGNFRTLLEYYAGEIMDNLNTRKELALLRFDQNQMESFGYAIVDEQNREAYLRGSAFRDIYGNHFASPNSQLVAVDYGNAEIERGRKYYVCACNPNNNVPLEVNLRFESFRKIAITTTAR